MKTQSKLFTDQGRTTLRQLFRLAYYFYSLVYLLNIARKPESCLYHDILKEFANWLLI